MPQTEDLDFTPPAQTDPDNMYRDRRAKMMKINETRSDRSSSYDERMEGRLSGYDEAHASGERVEDAQSYLTLSTLCPQLRVKPCSN